MIVIASVVLLLILVGGLVTLYFMNKNTMGNDDESSDVIVITDEGSAFETQTSGTETYIFMPRRDKCRARDTDPSWCGDITPSSEMNYVLDPVGGSITDVGDFETSWDADTNLCADGTQNCIYEEKFDENRKLIGITNAQGDDFIQKFIDDIYSGAIDFNVNRTVQGESQNLKELLQKMITFDPTTGKLTMKMPATSEADEMKTLEIIPGNTKRGQFDIEGKMKMAVGQMIVFIIFYYYSNDLPKPTIKLNLTSQKTLGEVFQALRDERAHEAAVDAAASPTGSSQVSSG
jgi:hypothetical protein